MLHVNFHRYRAHAASPAVRAALLAAGVVVLVPLLGLLVLALLVGGVVFGLASLLIGLWHGLRSIGEGVRGDGVRGDGVSGDARGRRNVRVVSRT